MSTSPITSPSFLAEPQPLAYSEAFLDSLAEPQPLAERTHTSEDGRFTLLELR